MSLSMITAWGLACEATNRTNSQRSGCMGSPWESIHFLHDVDNPQHEVERWIPGLYLPATWMDQIHDFAIDKKIGHIQQKTTT